MNYKIVGVDNVKHTVTVQKGKSTVFLTVPESERIPSSNKTLWIKSEIKRQHVNLIYSRIAILITIMSVISIVLVSKH